MNRIVSRPWGTYKVLDKSDKHWVKVLTLFPDQSISLQYHLDRSELWLCLEGEGKYKHGKTIGNLSSHSIYPGISVSIKVGDVHRLTNTSFTNLVVIEIAQGVVDEKDIVRIQDRYGRV